MVCSIVLGVCIEHNLNQNGVDCCYSINIYFHFMESIILNAYTSSRFTSNDKYSKFNAFN